MVTIKSLREILDQEDAVMYDIDVPDFKDCYVMEAFGNNPFYTDHSPRVHARRVRRAYLIPWAIIRLGEAYEIREATNPDIPLPF